MSTHFQENPLRRRLQPESVDEGYLAGRYAHFLKDAHINTATIQLYFSWAKIQPSEHEYNFG